MEGWSSLPLIFTNMKSTKQWLNELPDGYRERALKNLNLDDEAASMEEESIIRALNVSFVWYDSPEGHDFWNAVQEHYLEGTPLPPLPA
jgi:hypothetical protein